MQRLRSLAARAFLIGVAASLAFSGAQAAPMPRAKPAVVYLPAPQSAAPAAQPATIAATPVKPAEDSPVRDTEAMLWEIYRLLWLISAIALAVLAFAVWQALASRDASRRGLRAYIGVRPGTAPRLDTDWTDASVVVKNFGQTPAVAVDYALTLMMLDYPELPLENVMGAADKMFGHKAIVLAPGAELTLPLRTVLSEDEKHDTEDGTHKRLCALGEIRYTDAFGRKQATRFCFMYGGAAIISAREMQVAEKGNVAT